MNIILNPKFRIWAYSVCAAILVVLGTYGIVNGNQIDAFLFLASAVFGLAIGNVGTEKGKHEK